jgi:hypothetical protein
MPNAFFLFVVQFSRELNNMDFMQSTVNNRANLPKMLCYVNIPQLVSSGYHPDRKVMSNNLVFLKSLVLFEPRIRTALLRTSASG